MLVELGTNATQNVTNHLHWFYAGGKVKNSNKNKTMSYGRDINVIMERHKCGKWVL